MANLPWKKTTEVAKIIRSILKESFPEIKFSVRSKSYAGGSSISIHWTDGPTSKEVDAKVKHLQSVSHMDITDLVHHVPFSEHGGEKFNSMADHIFAVRRETVEFIQPIAEDAAVKYGYKGEYEIIENNGIMSHIIVDNTWRFSRDTFDYLVYKLARETNAAQVLEPANESNDERWPPTSLV